MQEIIPVSVVVPCYDVADTLERAIISVVNQTKLPQEIILVDDKSTDGTWNEMNKLKEIYGSRTVISIYRNEQNIGAGETRNSGWDKACGDYIAFLDADDAWFENKLEVQYNFMINNPQITMSCHKMAINNNKIDRKNINKLDVYMVNKYVALYKNPIMTPSVMVKRNIELRFKKKKRFSEDCWLWNHILASNLQVAFINIELAQVFKDFYGVSGLGSSVWKMEKGEVNNFLDLYREKKINIFFMTSGIVVSIIKFIRRLIIIRLR